MDDDRVDLSALDPARDPARWSTFVAATAARAAARRRASLARAVTGFGVPAFALAAAAAVGIWLLAPAPDASSPSSASALAPAPAPGSVSDGLAGWALEGVPDGAHLLSSLGGGDVGP